MSLRKKILIGLGVAVTGTLGFFGYKAYTKRKNKNDGEEEDFSSNTTSPSAPSAPSTSYFKPAPKVERNDRFPLQKGSKGERVRKLQSVLMTKYGKSILPKYGADGDFGSEMVAALEKLKLPSAIDESTYNVLVVGSAPDEDDLAEKLHKAAEDKSFSTALSLLKKIRNTSDYSKVSEKFKEYRIDGGVRKTLVNGMLSVFSSSSQKPSIQKEFLRMGLKYDGDKWSLSGIPTREIVVATVSTTVYDVKRSVKLEVPKGMVLGHFLQQKDGWTLFKTLQANKKLIVKSTHITTHGPN